MKISYSRASSYNEVGSELPSASHDDLVIHELKTDKVFKSPLKPSIESAVEHLHYEKSSKSFNQSPISKLPQSPAGSKQPPAKEAKGATAVEEPMIISKSSKKEVASVPKQGKDS